MALALTTPQKIALMAVLFVCVLTLSPGVVRAADLPPAPPTPFIVYVLKFLAVVGPFGAVAWKFYKVNDPISGFEAATWVIFAFFALVILWYVVDAVGEVITAL